jgi:hypothetical protein
VGDVCLHKRGVLLWKFTSSMSAGTPEQYTSDSVDRAKEQISVDDTGRTLTGLLAGILLLFGVVTVVWTIRLVIRCYTPAWVSDQWSMVGFLMETHDRPGLRALWSQHNEHRIILQRLAGLADMFWFGNRSISLRAEIIATQFLHLGVFVYACRRWGKFSVSTLAALAGFLAYCFFSPLQMENFNWGFQVTFVFVGLAASATILLMLVCKQQDGNKQQLLFLWITIAAAALTEMGNANGLLIWPILLFMAFVLELGRRKQLIVALCAAGGIAVYLIGYHSPAYHSNPLETVRHPASLCKYMLTCFGYSWDSTLPNVSSWPTVAEWCVCLVFIGLICLAVRCVFRRKREALLIVFVVADAMFFVGTVAMAAAGRIKFGYVQATSSRYQSFALVLWACAAIGIALFVRNQGWKSRASLNGAMLIVLLAAVGRWHTIETNELSKKVGRDQGWKALMSNQLGSPTLGYLFPDPGFVRGAYPYLVSHHLMSFSMQDSAPPVVSQRCDGWVDQAVSIGGNKMLVAGWAYDYTRPFAAAQVALVSPDGQILDSTGTGIARPDVPAATPTVESETSGWQAIWPAPPPGKYKMYVVIDGRADCALQGNVIVP